MESSFRFGDLPGGLRNRVYNELFTFRGERSTCYPQILTTCSWINEEAARIIEAINTETSIKLWLYRGVTDSGSMVCAQMEIHSQGFTRGHLRDMAVLPAGFERWPARLLKATHLKLNISSQDGHLLSRHDHEADGPAASEVLYALACFLQTSKMLRTVKVLGQGRWSSKTYQVDAARDIYPLARLMANFECDVDGMNLNVRLRRKLDENKSLSAELYSVSMMPRLRLLQAESDAYLEYAFAADPTVESEDDRSEHTKFRGRVLAQKNYWSKQYTTENVFYKHLRALESFLDRIYDNDAETTLKDRHTPAAASKAARALKKAHIKRMNG